MKELVTLVSCDWCYHASDGQTKVEATTTPPLTIGPRIRTLDLCEVHQQSLSKLRELVKAKGVSTGQPAAAHGVVMNQPLPISGGFPVDNEGNVECPLCNKKVRRTTMVGHIYGVHGDDTRPDTHVCPDCGKDCETWPRLAIHRTKSMNGSHTPYDNISEALAYVKGQPRGRAHQLSL